MKNNNPFNIYTSKVKRFNIPLPSFSYFHRASSEEKVDSKFIGRERNSKRLYAWLTEEKTKSGSYLITGYRGMGKSSFVGRILYELSIQISYKTSLVGFLAFIMIWAGGLWLGILSVFDVSYSRIIAPIALIVSGLLLISTTYFRFIIIDKLRRLFFACRAVKETFIHNNKYPDCRDMNFMEKVQAIFSIYKKSNEAWERINKELYNTNVSKKSYKRICISINLGQEILNEKDLLSLLTNQLYNKYREYIESPIANFKHYLLHTMFVFIIMTFMIISFSVATGGADLFCNELCKLFIIIIITPLIYLIYEQISAELLYSQKNKLKRLRFIKERIEAQINLEKSFNMNLQISKEDRNKAGASFNNRKNKNYPFADTREIEQELIDIMELISRGMSCPEFIFVFDELDKIESNNKQPFKNLEYTNEKNFPGGGTTRKRKQNVLHLLANMKLFISTAKAKFIFIAGRELYDAYLADLSDREFAISSIFNGVIYVESFCTNERREKDIMSNAETYICKQLIPKDFIYKECVRHYIKARANGKVFEHLDVNLKMYYKYLMQSYMDFFSKEKKNINGVPKDIRDCVDKAIMQLYHFSVYLYHISNGSPKKMSLYFEKYIRFQQSEKRLTFRRWNKDKSLLDNHEINIYIKDKAKYYLSFGYIDQRTIGFIHYISFPVTQIIINANQFGDKLLVSASFLINHIYKFHKSGFSWRNMEHTPELLEVYRIPEFRGFIDSILSYLTQSHIIPIICGLYQYKFRKQFSEEISLASKFSEEISALFNFTLDESLSVKQHYLDLLEEYNTLQEKEGIDNIHVIAGIHVIIADLYMADEEYTKAIFEYQTAIRLMTEDERKNNNKNISDQHAITRILFLIRNMLKLGLAFEKRKTYESAYVTYNELIGRLIDFRYLDEDSLGLNYAIKIDDNEHEAVLYSSGFPTDDLSVIKKVRPRINNIINKKSLNTVYSVNGSDIIVDFAHQMTREKNLIIQRLAMLEDIRLVYQAILAKLFVLEKVELGGITRANVELLESEYTFLHLATNEKNKFLISTDFFRRLGDIMFYKNGLTREFYKVSDGETSNDCFMEGLYLWSFNIRNEILDFCNENNYFNFKDKLIANVYNLKNCDLTIDDLTVDSLIQKIDNQYKDDTEYGVVFEQFKKNLKNHIGNIPLNKVLACNNHRENMWKENKHLPCFACKYYNKSLRLLIKNLFNVNLEDVCKQKKCSKVFVILHELIKSGSSKSLRQNFIIQLAEILDCMGNVMLSCTRKNNNEANENQYKCEITEVFLKLLLKDIHTYNRKDYNQKEYDTKEFIDKFELLKYYYADVDSKNDITLLEKSLMCYWEAFICFRLGNDFKKAAGSLKKILRTIQKYIKLDENNIKRKSVIGKYMNEIKDRILKQCLINIYSYYNYINIIEIQKIKWIFYVQMYESISLNRLSLFPDIEEIMIVYYEILSSCIIDTGKTALNEADIIKDYDIEERNRDFRIRLTGIYGNIALGTLRHESTIYERVLSLQFKTIMNQRILDQLFTEYTGNRPDYFDKNFHQYMIDFLNSYLKNPDKLKSSLKEYEYCFKNVFTEFPYSDMDNKIKNTHIALSLLEFLIKDSMYCLTRILEIITPYTSTTLFTNTFLGDIYQMLFKWNQVFDVLYMTYRVSETNTSLFPEISNNDEWKTGFYTKCPKYTNNKCLYFEYNSKHHKNDINIDISDIRRNKCPYYNTKCLYKLSEFENIGVYLSKYSELCDCLDMYKKYMDVNIAEVFFNDILKEIGKSNIHYTLSNYSVEMALKSYRQALDMHHEGKSYKETVSKMYYLDDDLKNDTIQFDLALERFRINNGYIDKNINRILKAIHNASIYDVENFCCDNETLLSLENRFRQINDRE